MQRVSLGKRKGRLTFGILCHALAIILVGRKAREAEEGERNVARPFMRHEIAVMRAAQSVDQRDPELRVFLEFGELVGIDRVAQDSR